MTVAANHSNPIEFDTPTTIDNFPLLEVPWEEPQRRSPDTFHGFGNLPFELRSKIWNEALPAPRLVFLTHYSPNPYDSRRPGLFSLDNEFSKAVRTFPFTCHESRTVFWKRYKRLSIYRHPNEGQPLLPALTFGDHPLIFQTSTQGYIDPRKDTLLLCTETILHLTESRQCLDISKINHLALPYNNYIERDLNRIPFTNVQSYWDFVRGSIKLQTLTVILNQDTPHLIRGKGDAGFSIYAPGCAALLSLDEPLSLIHKEFLTPAIKNQRTINHYDNMALDFRTKLEDVLRNKPEQIRNKLQVKIALLAWKENTYFKEDVYLLPKEPSVSGVAFITDIEYIAESLYVHEVNAEFLLNEHGELISGYDEITELFGANTEFRLNERFKKLFRGWRPNRR